MLIVAWMTIDLSLVQMHNRGVLQLLVDQLRRSRDKNLRTIVVTSSCIINLRKNASVPGQIPVE